MRPTVSRSAVEFLWDGFGLSGTTIGRILGCSESGIRSIAEQLGLPPLRQVRHRLGLSAYHTSGGKKRAALLRRRLLAINLRREGKLYGEIVERTGYAYQSLYDIFLSEGLVVPSPHHWHRPIWMLEYRSQSPSRKERVHNIKPGRVRDLLIEIDAEWDDSDVYLTEIIQIGEIEVLHGLQAHIDIADWDILFEPRYRKSTAECGWLGLTLTISYGRFSQVVRTNLTWLCRCLEESGTDDREPFRREYVLRAHTARSFEPAFDLPESSICTLAGVVSDDLALEEMRLVNERRIVAERERLRRAKDAMPRL